MKSWPKRPNTLSGKLRIIAPNLRVKGIEVAQDRVEESRNIHIVPIVEDGWSEHVNNRHNRHDRHVDDHGNDGHDANDSVQQESANQPQENCEVCGGPAPNGYPTSNGGVRHNGCEVSL